MKDAKEAEAEREKFETERAAKQAKHLAECKEPDCRTCKTFRGDPLNDPATPRCPTCNSYLGGVEVPPPEAPISLKRAAWAYGCAKKGSPEEQHALNVLICTLGVAPPSDGSRWDGSK